MGIPYYFASLLKSHKGIIQALKKGELIEMDVFAIDFNCLIHRYLKDEDPINSILHALDHILKTVCKAKTIIVAVDGLVPYAKIVNQRYRRMRVKDESIFDRTQISPDTPYMRELEKAVRTRFPNVIVNGTSIPGEGEHKMIRELRNLKESQRKSICIYGLDADLILIALQHHKLSMPHNMWLLRESGEFNDPKLKEAEFATLSVWKLLMELPLPIEQYIVLCIMCFGNDFMPNLGMFSLREDGYDRAIHIYEQSGTPDLTTIQGRNTFLEFASENEVNIFKERISLRKRPEEKCIIGKTDSLISQKYGLHILDGVQNITPIVEAFWKTFHWTLYYFQKSEPMNWYWVYPYSDAPLLQDIINLKETEYNDIKPVNFDIKQQLSFIMPIKSLRAAKRLVKYPDEIYEETRNPWMKRHDWEMKPRISLPWNPEYKLTTIISETSEHS
jgi:5'-3' exonuclease